MSVNPFDLKTIVSGEARATCGVDSFSDRIISLPAWRSIFWHSKPSGADWPKRRIGNFLVAAISTVPVLATGILAWQFALEGQKLKGLPARAIWFSRACRQ